MISGVPLSKFVRVSDSAIILLSQSVAMMLPHSTNNSKSRSAAPFSGALLMTFVLIRGDGFGETLPRSAGPVSKTSEAGLATPNLPYVCKKAKIE